MADSLLLGKHADAIVGESYATITLILNIEATECRPFSRLCKGDSREEQSCCNKESHFDSHHMEIEVHTANTRSAQALSERCLRVNQYQYATSSSAVGKRRALVHAKRGYR
jgi:hypothetical protein